MTPKARILRNDSGDFPNRSAYIDELLADRLARLARAAAVPKTERSKVGKASV